MPSSAARARQWTLLSLAIIVLITSALRLPLLGIPLERDEGEYAYIGWRLGHGELPYRDWVDQKPPGVFWAYQAALALPLEPIRAIHFMVLLWAAASACAVFYVARGFMNGTWAGITGVLFAIISTDPAVQGMEANTELFMLLPLILSQRAFFFAIPKGARQTFFMVLCGVLTGIAIAFKQVAAVNWLFLAVIFPMYVGSGQRLRSALVFAAWSASGVAAVWVFIGGYFLLSHGLGDFVYHVFSHNLEYVSTVPWSLRWGMFNDALKALSGTQVIIWAFSLMGLLALYATRRRKLLVYLAGWVISSLVGVSASGYYFPHYFQQILPALAVTSVIGAEWLCGQRWWGGVPVSARTAVLAAGLILLPAYELCPFLFKYTPASAVERIYPGNSFCEMPALGRRLAALTRPEDKVFIFGAEPELLFYARRVSATRYIFLFPLYGPYSDALEKQKATAAEITRAHPAAAVYLPSRLFSLPGSEQYFTRWSDAYLEGNFRGDRYLTVDVSNTVRVVPGVNGKEPVVPAGQQMIGALLVRVRP